MTYEEYNLFELDRVEESFKTIIAAAVSTPGAPVQVLMRREIVDEDTPRVALTLQTQQVVRQRFLLNPTYTDARWQPFNTWTFNLTAEIVTNRSQNNSQHLPIIGKTRLALQFYKLAPIWTTTFSPLHTIIDIREMPIELSVENIEDLDSTKINFTGMLCIRDGAWDILRPEPEPPSGPPINLTIPTITGPNNPPRVGDTLTWHAGTYSPEATLFAVEWVSPGSSIATPTFVVPEEFVGTGVQVYETASNVDGACAIAPIASLITEPVVPA